MPTPTADRWCRTWATTRSAAAISHLLDNLSDNNFTQTSPELREDILSFYRNPDAPLATKKKKKDWKRVQDELEELKTKAAAKTAAAKGNGGITSPGSESSGTQP